MDTKLKNNNKRGNLLTVIVLLISSVGMLLFYPAFSSYITDQDQKEMRKEEQMLDMLDPIWTEIICYIMKSRMRRSLPR